MYIQETKCNFLDDTENFTSMAPTSKITIGIADDQQLFAKSLAMLINTFEGFSIVAEGLNGKELLQKLENLHELPDIILLDVNMPVMDGVETAQAITKQYPLIKVVALTIREDDTTIISMLKAGCCAYLLKDIHPDELEKALLAINETGYYNADVANVNYRRLLVHQQKKDTQKLTKKELEFIKLACSELTYKQIAAQLHLAERTVDGYRESVFEKLNVQSRVGMVLEALRNNLISI